MGVLSDLALSGVDRVERRLGKRAALHALLPVLDTLPATGRSRALLRALRYAAELEETAPLEALSVRWSLESRARHADVREAVRELLAQGLAAAASRVAAAEVERTARTYDAASALYLLGRAQEGLHDPSVSLRSFERAIDAAAEQPRLRQAASVRAVRALSISAHGQRDEAARRAAALLPLSGGAPHERLAVAALALGSPGRYRRAAALDVLEQLARESTPVGRSAIARAARHAEEAGFALSDIETDRIEAILAHHPDAVARHVAVERLRALARIAEGIPSAAEGAAHTDPTSERFLPRARALLEGNAPGPRPAGGREALAWLGLDALHALGAGRPEDAARSLADATALVRAGGRVEGVLWTAATRSLPAVPMAGRRLLDALLAGVGEPPPRGFASVAAALLAAGDEAGALRALRAAASRREDGAREQLGQWLAHLGWRAAEAGRRDDAIALLREAKGLGRTGSVRAKP